jgi:type 1 glutamine amidotransferase
MKKLLALAFVGAIISTGHADEAKITEALGQIAPKVKVDKPRKALVYHKPSGFKHGSIPMINKCLELMATKTGSFTVELTDKVESFTADKLKQYDLLIFNNTTKVQKAFQTPEQRAVLLDYLKGGGGFVAIHSATDAGFPQWPEYTEMVGGVFDGHPWNAGGTWDISIDDPNHCCMDHFGKEPYRIKDELYKYKQYDRKNQRVLATIDTREGKTKKKGRADNDHALAWLKNYGKGRVFVSAFGHNNSVCWDKMILQLWLNGIQFAAGDLKCDVEVLAQPEWQKTVKQ